MKKLFVFTFSFWFLNYTSFSQEIAWQKNLGGSDRDELTSIKITSDGGVLLGGHSGSPVSCDKTINSIYLSSDFWIVKLDSLNTVQWQCTVDSAEICLLKSIDETSDKGCIAGGSYFNPTMDDYDYLIAKIDSSGILQWQKILTIDHNSHLETISQTKDGGYIIGGYSDTLWGNVQVDYNIMKLDSSGDIQWQKYIGSGGPDLLKAIVMTADGGYMIGGFSPCHAGGNLTIQGYGNDDYLLIKLDSSGNIQWQNNYGGSDYDRLVKMDKTFDGGYILGGYSKSSISGNKTDAQKGGDDIWMVKVDSMGLKQKEFSIYSKNNTSFINSIKQTSEGDYILGVSSSANRNIDKTENNFGYSNSSFNQGRDYWVLKLDSSGEILWQNTIGGFDEDDLNDLQISPDGGFVAAGASESYNGDRTENCDLFDYWIVKITEKFNMIYGRLFIDFNSNLLLDSNDIVLSHKYVKENISQRFSYSDENGEYGISVLDTGNYAVTAPVINYYNSVPLTNSASFSGINQIDSLNDFIYQPAGLFNDLAIELEPNGSFNVATYASYKINYKNVGTTAINGSIAFFPDDNLVYASSNKTPYLISADSVIWNIDTLNPFQTESIIVTFNSSVPLMVGSFISSNARIDPIVADAQPKNNFSEWAQQTVGAFDPNMIVVNKKELQKSALNDSTIIDYIVYFQNTGNDTAYNIKILNPIDTSFLNYRSFELISTSHPLKINYLHYAQNMEFVLDNILLPDSNINEPASHGHIHYRIKPKTILNVDDVILNQAYIYFDRNGYEPTNIVKTTIVSTLSTTPTSNFIVNYNIFCEDLCCHFTDSSSSNNTTYQWFFPGGIPSTSYSANPPSVCYSIPGLYDVGLIVCNSFDCDSVLFQDFIKVKPKPAVPTISQHLDTLFSSPADAYKWYGSFSPTTVLSVDSFFVFAGQSGYYHVKVIAANGCNEISTTLHMFTGISDVESKNNIFHINPVLNNGYFEIAFLQNFSTEVTIAIYNSLGEMIYSAREEFIAKGYKKGIDFTKASSGIYLVKIETDQSIHFKKLIVAK